MQFAVTVARYLIEGSIRAGDRVRLNPEWSRPRPGGASGPKPTMLRSRTFLVRRRTLYDLSLAQRW